MKVWKDRELQGILDRTTKRGDSDRNYYTVLMMMTIIMGHACRK